MFTRPFSTRQTGFTLIELVMVIIIIGVLAIVAAPKFIDLTAEASTAAADGVFGAAGSACSINFVAVKVKATGATPITDCPTLAGSMTTAGVTLSAGTAGECVFTIDGGNYAFTFAPESTSAPCQIAKSAGKWPAP